MNRLKIRSISAGLAVCTILSSTVLLSGCGDQLNELTASLTSELKGLESSVLGEFSSIAEVGDAFQSSSSSEASQASQTSEVTEASEDPLNPTVTYTMADVWQLNHTDYFASGTLEHIFDGTINKKGKATGYHYTMISDSKGSIIDGTRSKTDEHGVFTAKVTVDGVKKNGFSSFYPESWTPQQVVDAINTAYEEAKSNPENPSGTIWIGHCGDLEIDMYLNDAGKITTAFPIYEGD